MKITFSGNNVFTFYEDDNHLVLPVMLKEYYEGVAGLSKASGTYNNLEVDEAVYCTDKFVAYADLDIEFTPKYQQGKNGRPNKLVKVTADNISRKEYFADKVGGMDKVANGMQFIADYHKYVKKCDDGAEEISFTPKFV